jgi:flagellar biosynthesis/type III secretory pathway M-ring protein FliF/YscJ
MFSPETIALLIAVISSWQVIAITIVIVLYFLLVTYVARLYRRPRAMSARPSKPHKKEKAAPAPAETPEAAADDELGLES